MNLAQSDKKATHAILDPAFIKNILVISLVFIDTFNLMVIQYIDFIILKHTFKDMQILIYLVVYAFFNLWALVIIFKKSFQRQFYLYVGLFYTVLSLYYIYVYFVLIHIVVKVRSNFDILLIVITYFLIQAFILKKVLSRKRDSDRNNDKMLSTKLFIPSSAICAVVGSLLSVKVSRINSLYIPIVIQGVCFLILALILSLISQHTYRYIFLKPNNKNV